MYNLRLHSLLRRVNARDITCEHHVNYENIRGKYLKANPQGRRWYFFAPLCR